MTPVTADLEIKKGKNVLWTRRTENRVPPILFLAEGETVQQAVSKFERPEASFFETLNIPPRIALAEISQSIGLSALEGVPWKDSPLDIVNRNRRH